MLARMPKDLIYHMGSFLCFRDIQYLHRTSKIMQHQTRQNILERTVWHLPSPKLNGLHPKDRKHVKRILFCYSAVFAIKMAPFRVTHLSFRNLLINNRRLYSIPNTVTHLCLPGDFNLPLQPRILPDKLTHLMLGFTFNQTLVPGDIPSSVTHLAFGGVYNHPIENGVIPSNVTHLYLGVNIGDQNCMFSIAPPIVFPVIPRSVTHLKLPDSLNMELTPGYIPPSVTHLTFGFRFDSPVNMGDVPSSVTHLTFGKSFNTLLKPGVIPHGTTHLNLGDCFNKPLAYGVIPSSVTHLTLGRSFQQLKNSIIPFSVTHIYGNDPDPQIPFFVFSN
jgi:hypothetical protein